MIIVSPWTTTTNDATNINLKIPTVICAESFFTVAGITVTQRSQVSNFSKRFKNSVDRIFNMCYILNVEYKTR